MGGERDIEAKGLGSSRTPGSSKCSIAGGREGSGFLWADIIVAGAASLIVVAGPRTKVAERILHQSWAPCIRVE